VKFTFLILPDSYDSNVWIFLGIEFQRNLYINSFSRLYALGGIGYHSLFFTIGPGLGYELFSGSPGIAINLDLGLIFLKPIDNPHGSMGSKDFELRPGFGLGLSYAY
ncbi:hypothetical protein ACFLSQ_09245, partial [Bacteroidota bacterium]